jgi:hypothetical protein
MMTAPEFGKELRRAFEVHENCYDCAEFYGPGRGVVVCNAWPASKAFNCADFLRLPDVMPGTSGQVFPPSRMGDRKEPRIRSSSGAPVRPRVQPEKPPARQLPQTNPHREYPAANYGLAGERLCQCGARLPKRKKCCETCREKRRAETLHGRRNREGALRRVQTVSDVPFSGPATLPAQPTACAHR